MTERETELILRLTDALERMAAEENRTAHRRRMWMNLQYGVMRGLGFTLGFTVLGALMMVILRHIAVENITGIGSFFAELIEEIQSRR